MRRGNEIKYNRLKGPPEGQPGQRHPLHPKREFSQEKKRSALVIPATASRREFSSELSGELSKNFEFSLFAYNTTIQDNNQMRIQHNISHWEQQLKSSLSLPATANRASITPNTARQIQINQSTQTPQRRLYTPHSINLQGTIKLDVEASESV